MPIKILQDGNEIEVFTPDEVAAQVSAKATETAKEWEMKSSAAKAELDKVVADKTALEAKIASGGGAQADNFKTLKEALDKKDAEIAAKNKEIADAEVARTNEQRDAVIGRLAGNNEDLKKKILHHFSETLKGVQAKTQEEVNQKIESAYKLSVDTATPNVLQNAINGAGGPGFVPAPGSGPVEFTATEKGLGAKLGITEEDYKKFGPRLKTKIK